LFINENLMVELYLLYLLDNLMCEEK
jgi:hypothetical protein